MEIYQAITLGIIQGLTEFLPVSSSGHLVLGQLFFGITEPVLAFDISVHMGTLGAVFVIYWRDIMAMVTAMSAWAGRIIQRKSAAAAPDTNLKLAVLILAGSVPTAMMGMFLKQFEHILFTSSLLVGAMMLVTGTILWTSRKFYRTKNNSSGLDMKRSLVIGASQGLAVIPGISRAGTTIACGMFCGLDRHTAAKFSFLLSIPAIMGAQLVSVMGYREQGAGIDAAMIYGTLVAFVTGLVALKVLIRMVHAGKFHLFAPYCWLVGALVVLSNIYGNL
ncbi:MAG TPA: undecaprenyl-diphosphate phosphatase [Desulfotignum sp.]|nr:undecaprenyl-diphosphate phosphatase [Desulfotignum sp.]